MPKSITIDDQTVILTEVDSQNVKSVQELLTARVQYAILDQLNDMASRSGMENPDEIKKLLLRDIAFKRGGYSSSFTFNVDDQTVILTEADSQNAVNIQELLTARVQYAILDQLNHMISESDNPNNELRKLKDSILGDITKIIDNFIPLEIE